MKQGTVGTYGSESLPNITGTAYGTISQRALGWSGTGALSGYLKSGNNVYPQSIETQVNANNGFTFNAANSSSTYQNNAKVNPDNAEILYVIKF